MLRLLISPTRSGSTAFLRCFENNPHVTRVLHQPVKSGYRQDGTFDYGFFSMDNSDPEKIFVAKETIGGFEPPETEFSPVPKDQSGKLLVADRFPSVEAIEKVRPVFMFREPLQTWNSIHKLNEFSSGRSPFFSPFEYFTASYKNTVEFLRFAREITNQTYCLTLEHLAGDPASVFQSICEKWEIPYVPQMINWALDYGERTAFSKETLHRMKYDARFKRSKEQLEATWKFKYEPSEIERVAPEQRQVIERDIRSLYEYAQQLTARDFP